MQQDLFPIHPDKYYQDHFILCPKCNNRQISSKHQCIQLDNSPYLPVKGGLAVQNFRITLDTGYKPESDFKPSKFERGTIESFSRKSARRMKLKLAEADFSHYQTKLFATFTFHEIWPETPEELNKVLLRIIKRIERLRSDVTIVWRKEYQERGAPHFHLILLIPARLNNSKRRQLAASIKKHWGDITHFVNPYAFTMGSDIRELSNSDQVLHYLSKYVAKPSSLTKLKSMGRIWGIRGNLMTINPVEFDCSEKFMIEMKKQYLSSFSARVNLDGFFTYYVTYAPNVKLIIAQKFLYLLVKEVCNKLNEYPINPETGETLLNFLEKKKE